jgi:hypothetical protein
MWYSQDHVVTFMQTVWFEPVSRVPWSDLPLGQIKYLWLDRTTLFDVLCCFRYHLFSWPTFQDTWIHSLLTTSCVAGQLKWTENGIWSRLSVHCFHVCGRQITMISCDHAKGVPHVHFWDYRDTDISFLYLHCDHKSVTETNISALLPWMSSVNFGEKRCI